MIALNIAEFARSRSFRLLGVILCALMMIGAIIPLGIAQDHDGLAYVSPVVPDDPNLAKVAMLRLWYVGSVDAPSICLVRQPESGRAKVLESHLGVGLFSPYVPLKPGSFTLHILDGDITQPESASEELPLEEKKLTEPTEIELEPGSYATLVVREENGVIKSFVIPDKLPATGGPRLRVVNLTDLNAWQIRLVDQFQKPIREIWNSGLPGKSMELSKAGIYFLDVVDASGPEERHLGLFQAQLSAKSQFTIVMFPDMNGGAATNLLFDAAPGSFYNAEDIRKIAEGG